MIVMKYTRDVGHPAHGVVVLCLVVLMDNSEAARIRMTASLFVQCAQQIVKYAINEHSSAKNTYTIIIAEHYIGIYICSSMLNVPIPSVVVQIYFHIL